MREILFRGKRVDDNEWCCGYFVSQDKESYIFEQPEVDKGIDLGGYLDCCQMSEVIPETVGQYTGLTDKNGRQIFEGDIVDVSENPQFIYVGVALYRYGLFNVVYDKSCFMKRKITDKNDEKGLYHFLETEQYQVVGNIFDNSELLKGGEQ